MRSQPQKKGMLRYVDCSEKSFFLYGFVSYLWTSFNHLKRVQTVSCLHSGQIITIHPATKRPPRSFGAVQEVSPHKKSLF